MACEIVAISTFTKSVWKFYMTFRLRMHSGDRLLTLHFYSSTRTIKSVKLISITTVVCVLIATTSHANYIFSVNRPFKYCDRACDVSRCKRAHVWKNDCYYLCKQIPLRDQTIWFIPYMWAILKESVHRKIILIPHILLQKVYINNVIILLKDILKVRNHTK